MLYQEGVEDSIEVADKICGFVESKNRFGNHVLDLTDAKVLPVLLKNRTFHLDKHFRFNGQTQMSQKHDFHLL